MILTYNNKALTKNNKCIDYVTAGDYYLWWDVGCVITGNDTSGIPTVIRDVSESPYTNPFTCVSTQMSPYPTAVVIRIPDDKLMYSLQFKNNYNTTFTSIKIKCKMAAVSMKNTFAFCKINKLDISELDTSNVTDMTLMFGHTVNLTNIDLSNLNTQNVTDMGSMFSGCINLTSLNCSNFNTANVTNMSYMFDDCRVATSINCSSFDTSNVTDMHEMFSDCPKLVTLDLSNFKISSTTNIANILNDSDALRTIYVDNCDDYTISKLAEQHSFTLGTRDGRKALIKD